MESKTFLIYSNWRTEKLKDLQTAATFSAPGTYFIFISIQSNQPFFFFFNFYWLINSVYKCRWKFFLFKIDSCKGELIMVLTAVIWATEQTPAPLQESPEQLFTSKHLNKTTSVSGYDSAYVLTQNTIKHESQLAS